ncbi:MAG: hypothetical protein JWQ10_2237 [Herbaspirillum sp.]|nr:hypothetical protein [Herbaspirillum sp.]
MPISLKRFRLSALYSAKLARKCAFIALAGCSLSAVAQDVSKGFAPDSYVEPETKVWQESAFQLPAPPVTANLMEFYVGPTATQSFFIDEKSLSIAGDGVIRYTLVSKSKSGAVNISYEGIRCATDERKQYAYGMADNTWVLARDPIWHPITELVANRQHAALVKDYFCDTSIIAGTVPDIVKRIKFKQPLSLTQDVNRR